MLSRLLSIDASRAHSWLYWATRVTPPIRSLVLKGAMGILILAVFLIGASGPDLPWNWGWNTIEHVSDPIPFHGSGDDGATAMARSGGWLALVTPKDGLNILSAGARVPVGSISGKFRDVAAGPDRSSFYTLDSAQGIGLATRQGWGWASTPWLEAPTSPFWNIDHPIRPGDVVYSEIDQSGLVVGLRGAGIARNVFAASQGKISRTRNWQLSGTLSSVNLGKVLGTEQGYWLALNQGGLRFADRKTLDEIRPRSISTGPIRQLNASKQGDWASAIEEGGAAWTFDQSNGWKGPWFNGNGVGPSSAAVVTSARLLGGDLWMGSAEGLVQYNLARHEMKPALSGTSVQSIEAAGNELFAATSTGLRLFKDGEAPIILDNAKPRGLQVDSSGDALVYWTDDLPGGTLYAIAAPSKISRPTRMQVQGWGKMEVPIVRGVLDRGEAALFATNIGCFSYDERTLSYQDCSAAIVPGAPQRRLPLGSFDSVSQEDGAVVASVDGEAAFLNRDDGRTWAVIGPSSQIARTTAVSGQIYTLDRDRSISRFDAPKGQQVVVGAAAPSLGTGSGPFRGDLAGDDRHWRLVVARPGSLVEYDSDQASWRTIPTPFDPPQVVILGDKLAVVTPSSSVETFPDAVEQFGGQGLPFSPTHATTLAPGIGNTVLVGGPSGQVARYDFRSGSWKLLPSLGTKSDSIVELEELPDELWARTSSGAVFRLGKDGWTSKQSIRRWASSPTGSLWILTALGAVAGSDGAPDANVTFGGGSGVKPFLERARYVWQPDPDRVILVAPDGVGSFDRRNDAWSYAPGAVQNPTRFVPSGNALLILDGGQVKLLTAGLRTVAVDSGSAAPVLDIAAGSGSGLVWMLKPGEAVEYRLSGDTALIPERRIAVAAFLSTLEQVAATTREINLGPAPASDVVLRYGALGLAWSLNPAGGVVVKWLKHPELRVWCSDEQRLAVQCSHDLWVDRGNAQLVFATEAGVLRRPLADLSSPALIPAVSTTLDQLRHAPTPVDSTILWQLGGGELSASLGGTVLGWTQSNAIWRLDVDLVRQIRATSDHTLTIETRAGSWAWDSREGRTGPVAPPGRPSLAIVTPAIDLSLDDDQVRMAAPDGGPTIVAGRFYFDGAADIRGYRGSLYAFIPGRAVIRRGGSAPGQVDALWPLPAPAAHTAGWSLLPGVDGIRLGKAATEYELSTGAGGSAWRQVQPISNTVATGPFAWRQSARGEWAVSYGGTGQPITSWWSRGRFAWDDYLAAGPLDGKLVALATPVGVVIRPVQGGSLTLLLGPAFTSSTPARIGPKIVGTLFDGIWLVHEDASGRPELIQVDLSLDQQASVALEPVQDPKLGKTLTFREEWHKPTVDLALSSSVPSIPTAWLLEKGRFIFDAPMAVARLAQGRWLAVTGCDSSLGCLGATFAESDGALVLTAIRNLPEKIVWFGSGGGGQLLGATQEGRVFRLGGEGAAELSTPQVGDAFDSGDITRLELDMLSWTKRPAKVWDTEPRIVANDPNYPLFYQEHGHAAFSFDVVSTIATNVRDRQLSVGTAGGIFSCPARAHDRPEVELARNCKFEYRSRENGTKSLLEISRLRWADDDRLSILNRLPFETLGEMPKSPPDPIRIGGSPIEFLSEAIRIGNNVFQESNDAWWIGRRPFSRIVDFSYDEDNRTLWLCDQDQGLFAVKIDSHGR